METIPAGVFGAEIMARADALGRCTDVAGELTRVFLGPAYGQAAAMVTEWMVDAGMTVRTDAIGNVVGRYEGSVAGLPALVLGSHLDTVRDAGKYDGALGVIAPISAVKWLRNRGERLNFAIEVIGFADEEGVRFQTAFLGSHAVAGIFDAALLAHRDDAGVSMADALGDHGFDPAAIDGAARRRQQVLGYVEMHIEQGPVLEVAGLPVGVVTSINGSTRLEVSLSGEAGHAGTVPIELRRDALTAAAEAVLAVEKRCSVGQGLVGTVGKLVVAPGAANVIPGQARFTVDIRAPKDPDRAAAVDDVVAAIAEICARRNIGHELRRAYETPSCDCAPWLIRRLDAAISAHGLEPRHLPSGAGHDAMSMAALTDVGMLFVRCEGGVSHNPVEAIQEADADTATRVLCHFVRNFQPNETS